MKKVISLFLIAVLISGCNRMADNVSTAPQSLNASAPVPQSQNAPALAPQSSNAPALAPAPSKSASHASDSADTGSSVKKVGTVILSVIGLCYVGYKLLYRFVDIKPISVDKLKVFDITADYEECYLYNGYLFDATFDEYVDEIPVRKKNASSFDFFYYKSNPSRLKLLKAWLRDILKIDIYVVNFY